MTLSLLKKGRKGYSSIGVEYPEHSKSWLNEPGVCASPYDLISHEHMPHQLTKLHRPEDLQNKSECDVQELIDTVCVLLLIILIVVLF